MNKLVTIIGLALAYPIRALRRWKRRRIIAVWQQRFPHWSFTEAQMESIIFGDNIL